MSPTILFININEEEHPELGSILSKNGYNVVFSIDESSAIERAKDGRIYPYPSLILVNQFDAAISVDPPLEIGKRVRQSTGLPSDTAVAAIFDHPNQDIAGKYHKAGAHEYVIYPVSEQKIVDFLDYLFKTGSNFKAFSSN